MNAAKGYWAGPWGSTKSEETNEQANDRESTCDNPVDRRRRRTGLQQRSARPGHADGGKGERRAEACSVGRRPRLGEGGAFDRQAEQRRELQGRGDDGHA